MKASWPVGLALLLRLREGLVDAAITEVDCARQS